MSMYLVGSPLYFLVTLANTNQNVLTTPWLQRFMLQVTTLTISEDNVGRESPLNMIFACGVMELSALLVSVVELFYLS